MNIDLKRLQHSLKEAAPEDSVSHDDVNAYLFSLAQRLLAGEDVTYGEIDFSQFEADDLRVVSYYCQEREGLSQHLYMLVGNIDKAKALSCKARAFC